MNNHLSKSAEGLFARMVQADKKLTLQEIRQPPKQPVAG